VTDKKAGEGSERESTLRCSRKARRRTSTFPMRVRRLKREESSSRELDLQHSAVSARFSSASALVETANNERENTTYPSLQSPRHVPRSIPPRAPSVPPPSIPPQRPPHTSPPPPSTSPAPSSNTPPNQALPQETSLVCGRNFESRRGREL
jgi:hypothetical protein